MISLPSLEAIIHKTYWKKLNDRILLASIKKENHCFIYSFSKQELSHELLTRMLYEAWVSSLVKIRKNIVLKNFPLLGSWKIDYKKLTQYISDDLETPEPTSTLWYLNQLKHKISFLCWTIEADDITNDLKFGEDIYLDSIDVWELLVFLKVNLGIQESLDTSNVKFFGDLVTFVEQHASMS